MFFWFIVRPQRRRVAAHRAFVAALDVGDEVVTSGGLYGTVRALDEASVELEVAPSVVIKVARGAIVSRAPGVLAGRMAAAEAFHQVDPTVRLQWDLDDGASVVPGSVVVEVGGPLRSILSAERTALNFLCHLSGVATLTRRYVAAVGGCAEGGDGPGAGATRVLDTRKTTPGLRALEKAAVRAGGGANHRGSLSEGVLVKDNHLTGMGIAQAVALARARWPGRMVEVECDRPQ